MMRMLEELADQKARGDIELNEWEEGFVASMQEREEAGRKLTDTMWKKLHEIYERHIGDTR